MSPKNAIIDGYISNVIPAKAGIQTLDPRFRGGDMEVGYAAINSVKRVIAFFANAIFGPFLRRSRLDKSSRTEKYAPVCPADFSSDWPQISRLFPKNVDAVNLNAFFGMSGRSFIRSGSIGTPALLGRDPSAKKVYKTQLN